MRVLVAEDDGDVQFVVRRALEEEGHEVVVTGDGAAALEAAAAHPPDLVLLDLDMPGVGGLDALESLRQRTSVPVIIITGRGSEGDRVLGLDLGADDYVVKPFSTRELQARVRALLRRAAPTVTGALEFDDLSVDLSARQVRRAGEVVMLSRKEFDLLAHLASSPRRAFSREELLSDLWGRAEGSGDSTLSEHVRRLRQKIEDDVDNPRHVVTVRGIGYRFEP